jgi:hypothetical protein
MTMPIGGSEKDKNMKTQVQVAFDKKNNSLIMAGWIYLGADFWVDPTNGNKHMTTAARKVQRQRDNFAAKQKKPTLILCSDWESICNELNRQLKPLGLHITTKGNYKKWGDRLLWTVAKKADPAYDKYKAKLDKLGIDPWNCYS